MTIFMASIILTIISSGFEESMSSIRKIVSQRTGEATWQVDYKDAAGVRRAKNFKKKRDAEGWRTKTDRDLQLGLHTPDAISLTVAEASELWITSAKKRRLERSTLRQYEIHAERHINPVLGSQKLSRLTTPAVEAFIDDLEASASLPTARKVLSSLRSIIGEAQRQGYVAQNVAQMVRRRISTRDKADKVIPTKDEIRLLVGSASGRWRPLIITAIFSGMRASELRGLRWHNVDLEKGIIKVRERADEWARFGPPKSRAGTRDIPVAPVVIEELQRWQADCPVGDLNLVFPNGAGNVESQANIYSRGFAPLMKVCRIVDSDGSLKFNFHALRHAYASLMIEHGMSPKRIQTIMGHSSITMTFDTYGHLWDNFDEDKLAMKEIQGQLLG